MFTEEVTVINHLLFIAQSRPASVIHKDAIIPPHMSHGGDHFQQ